MAESLARLILEADPAIAGVGASRETRSTPRLYRSQPVPLSTGPGPTQSPAASLLHPTSHSLNTSIPITPSTSCLLGPPPQVRGNAVLYLKLPLCCQKLLQDTLCFVCLSRSQPSITRTICGIFCKFGINIHLDLKIN